MAENSQTEFFMGVLFVSRDLAHREHLKTNSYARHKALGKFYGSIIDLADSFAEAYQGKHNKRLDIPLVNNELKGDMSEILRRQVEWINDNRKSICEDEDTAINNIVDEIVGLYYSTLYLLTLE